MAYTTIDDPSVHFQTDLYTGTGSSLSITNDGNSDLQPDWVWIKERNALADHALYDSSRGVQEQLESNNDTAETTESTGLTAFGSDGFTVGALAQVNTSSDTYVAWQWKANGGTTSSNTDGSITSTVQANTDAGFSIVTYTGNGTDGSTVGHGLGAVPAVVIFKCRDTTNTDWRTYHQSISPTNAVSVNSTGAQYAASSAFTSAFSSTQLKLENEAGANGAAKTYVAYCFAEKQGYSKFGKYEGNGNADGTFVYTGFKPAFVMTKSIDSTSDWNMFDHKREGYNVDNDTLEANDSAAESTTDMIDLLSNGFKLRIATDPNVAETYIYIAFAENPFVTSTGIPTTAR